MSKRMDCDRRVLLKTAAASLALAASGVAARAQQKTLIGVALPQDDNPFYINMLKGMRERAAALGYEVAAVSSNEDKARQIAGVEDLIARGAKGILISPIDASGVNAAYSAAAKAKVPIISVARGSSSPDQTYYIAMNEVKVGEDIGAWTAKRLGGKGKIAMLLGPSGAPTFRNLEQGFLKAIAAHPDMQVVFRTQGPLTRERGLREGEDALVKNPDLAAIYAANDDVSLGAVQAVAATGRVGKTIVTGMNGSPPGLRAIKEGKLAMSIELNPAKWGALGVDVMDAFLKGNPPKSTVYVDHRIIDSSNIGSL